MRRAACRLIALLLAIAGPTHVLGQESVTVAPGLTIERRTYDVSPNEAPFFNFIDKTPEMRRSDEDFVARALSGTPVRRDAAKKSISLGWEYIRRRELGTAMKRFNQAYLLDPENGGVYHGYAVLVLERFRDPDYAGKLFELALAAPRKPPGLTADYGRFLLIRREPAKAASLLERATRDLPENPNAWLNYATALFLSGDATGACRALETLSKLPASPPVSRQALIVGNEARC